MIETIGRLSLPLELDIQKQKEKESLILVQEFFNLLI